jgi:AcrR family transcriptional regulator
VAHLDVALPDAADRAQVTVAPRMIFAEEASGPACGCWIWAAGAGTWLSWPPTWWGPEGCVVGVDRSPDAPVRARLRARQRGLTQVRFVEGDIHDPAPGGPFDAIVSRLVLWATAVTDIAREAGVAVQTIYAWLGSKRGMLMALMALIDLIDLIDQEAGVGGLAAFIRAASTPEDTLAAEVRLTRAFQERCGDIIGPFSRPRRSSRTWPPPVAGGQRRHRDGARLAVARIAEFGGLRENLAPERAAALIAIVTTHEAWRELRDAYRLSWDDAETLLLDILSRAVMTPSPARQAGDHRETAPAGHRAAS